jgi:hypothetical protein
MACSGEPSRFLLLIAIAWSSSGCAGLLGLDQGSPDTEGGADAPDGTTAWPGDGFDGGEAIDAKTDTLGTADEASAIDSASESKDAAPLGDDANAAAEAGDSGFPPPPPDTGTPCALTTCGDACYDTSSDPDHCGNCTTVCPHGSNSKPVCTNGACGQECDQGYVDCGGHACSCGAGNRCLSDGTCGTCRATLQACKTGSDCCSGACTLNLTCL